ncbi:PA-phosphatase-like phosphoesterase [Nitritalea halalkaliphila LW7]|uniref:PA-phosphatase-like phosphoesterase n=1 Tax=Nitritalea halalkaliphila LW7 TaxID=1189621 RepID=I5C7P5_9BACT|nr:phosphatase PAP2 family protein [Nitritalea halalkaliphila]EIM77847.1 PA-phosphatase-like phosphoesterase [Nitritalea halalkaliphila LW7]
MEKLIAWDEQASLWLNQYHQEWLDPILFTATHTWPWIPLYVLLSGYLIRSYGLGSWVYFVGLALVITLADQGTSSLMKPYFERLRPCHDERWVDVLHNYGKCGGMYGFASSHASNSFGIAAFFIFGFAKKQGLMRLLWVWAAFFSYTRVYLGVHYLGDIIVGAAVGVLAAGLVWLLLGYFGQGPKQSAPSPSPM